MAGKILFYSSVTDKKLFNVQRFYITDILLLKENGYDVILSNTLFDTLYFWKYDLAFIYFYRWGVIAAILAKLFCKKIYFTGGIDDLDEEYAEPKRYYIQKFFFKISCIISDSNIIVSKSDLKNIAKIYPIKLPKCLSYSEHTIDVSQFYTSTNKDKIFTTIAWMGGGISNVLRKGIDKALYVFAHLITKPEFANYSFVVIGKKGEGSEYLENVANQLQIMDKVSFIGDITEKQKTEHLARSKYYFQLSEYEGFGIAAIEALASQNIVIHSAKGGLEDTMQDFGVFFDIDSDMQVEVEKLYKNLLAYNTYKLEESVNYVTNRFSNERRRIDFQNILK